VVNHGGNLRGEPVVSAGNVLGQACPGDTVTLLDQRGTWYQVRVEATPQSCDPKRVAAGTTGWLSASLLTLSATTLGGPAPAPTAKQISKPTVRPAPTAMPTAIARSGCDPSYPTVCIPPPPPDLDCKDIPYRRFKVLPPDPHHFDGNHDGVGCEG
jgi:hypothetical protein